MKLTRTADGLRFRVPLSRSSAILARSVASQISDQITWALRHEDPRLIAMMADSVYQAESGVQPPMIIALTDDLAMLVKPGSALAKNVIALARQIGAITIADGVNSQAEIDALIANPDRIARYSDLALIHCLIGMVAHSSGRGYLADWHGDEERLTVPIARMRAEISKRDLEATYAKASTAALMAASEGS